MTRRIAFATVRLVLLVTAGYILAPYAVDHLWNFGLGALALASGAAMIGYEHRADQYEDVELRHLRLRIIEMAEGIADRREQENDE